MKKSKLASILPLFALVFIVVVAWCITYDRTTAESWGVPYEYNGDSMQILGWMQAASEGDYIPVVTETNHRLGAPYEADWKDFPMYEKILIFVMGMMTKVFGLFPASNAAMLLGHVLSALSFYLCCRFLKHSKTWAFVGALLFAFTYYNLFRRLGHLLLAYSYILPFAVVSTWLIMAGKQLRLWNRLCWLCLVTAFVMGLSNPYNLNIYGQLVCFALLVQYLTTRRMENLKIGLMMLGLIVAGFVIINSGTFVYHWIHGSNPEAIARNYFETELYALKIIEFFVPPPIHQIPALASIGDKYQSLVFVRGEMFSPYLGFIGIAGLFWMFGESFLLILRKAKQPRRFPPYALQATWIIFYSMVGGLNCLIALAGFPMFRATNRYSMYISTLILLFLVARLSVLSRRWTAGRNYALAAAVLAFGLFDQLQRPVSASDTAATESVVKADQAFGRQLEEKLPHGAMVFELPVMTFPEAGPINEINGGYEMFRPYFNTKTLRFSFGAVKGRPREDWQADVERMPAPQMIAALEKYGFSAIYIDRKGFQDHGVELLGQLAAAGRNQTIEDDRKEEVCVLLNPSPKPELPHTDERAMVLYRKGWTPVRERSANEVRRWSSGNATLSFFCESRQYTSYSVKFLLGSISPRHVTLSFKGREVWNGEIQAGQAVPVDLLVDGQHGNNYLEFTTDQPPARPKGANVALAFTVINLEITKTGSGN